jgi:hypothetical protein
MFPEIIDVFNISGRFDVVEDGFDFGRGGGGIDGFHGCLRLALVSMCRSWPVARGVRDA